PLYRLFRRLGQNCGATLCNAPTGERRMVISGLPDQEDESAPFPANPYFFKRSMSDPRLRPRRRAASDWLPATEASVRAITFRSSASTCSRKLSVPSGGGSAPASAAIAAAPGKPATPISPPPDSAPTPRTAFSH